MGAWLGVLVVGTAVLMWGLRREFDRLEREAALRRWLDSESGRRLHAHWRRFSEEVGVALLPAAQRMAAALIDLGPKMQALGDAMNKREDRQ